LSGDAFEDQMFFLASHGYRVIAHDRRGHGRSSQPWHGNDMDTYAHDLAELLQKLNLKTQSMSAIPPAAAKLPATSVATARSGSRRWF
jgi:non-heme chloroperoxidase